MASFVNVTNLTYCGEKAKEIFIKDLYESKLKTYGLTYMPGVKGRQQLATGDVSELFQAFTCPFSPNGEVTLDEKWIESVAMKVNLEECYDKFWPTFMSAQTEISLNGGIPQTFFEWFFDGVLQKELGKEYEEIFWNGDSAKTGHLAIADGIVKQLTADTKVNKIEGSTITVSNVLAQVQAVALAGLATPAENFDDFKIFMNKTDYRLLVAALGSAKIMDNEVWSNFGKDGDKVYAYGFEVVPCAIAKDAILLAPAKNLVLGYDIADSEISYKIIDMRDTTLDNTFRVGVITNIAIGYVYPELMVISNK